MYNVIFLGLNTDSVIAKFKSIHDAVDFTTRQLDNRNNWPVEALSIMIKKDS